MISYAHAHAIAQRYLQKYKIEGEINCEKTSYYADFVNVEGAVWLVIVDTPPSPLEGDDAISVVVSIEAEEVHHCINRSGFVTFYHSP